jgi:hypothetical protein
MRDLDQIFATIKENPFCDSFFVCRPEDELWTIFWECVAEKMGHTVDDDTFHYYSASTTKNALDEFVLGSTCTERFYRLYPTLEVYKEAMDYMVKYPEGCPEDAQVDEKNSVVHFKWRDVFIDPDDYVDGSKTHYYEMLDTWHPFIHRVALVQELLDLLDPFNRYDKIEAELTALEETLTITGSSMHTTFDHLVHNTTEDTIHSFVHSWNDIVASLLLKRKELAAAITTLEKELWDEREFADPFSRENNNTFPYIPIYRRV